MTRFLSLAAALVASAAALTAAAGPARAQGPARGPFYVAVPEAVPAATARPAVMTRATGWALRDGRYLAARAPERPALLCDLLARDVGRLQSFSAGGEVFDADDLAKCNRRAKGPAPTAMAAAR